METRTGVRMAEEFLDDSLQQIQESREGPEPISRQDRGYELTFKKNHHGSYFFGNKGDNHQAFVSNTERQILSSLRLPIKAYFSSSLQQLASLPFADLYSLSLNQYDQVKLSLVGEILEQRRLQQKSRSATINVRCLQSLQSLTNEEKHRLYLLQLLQKQLNKKRFVTSLKINRLYRKFKRQHPSEPKEELNNSNPEQLSPHRISQHLFEEESEDEHKQQENQRQESHINSSYQNGDSPYKNGSSIYKVAGSPWKSQQEEGSPQDLDSEIEGQLIIMMQVLSSIGKKQLFWAFNTLSNLPQRKNSHSNTNNGDISPIPLGKKSMRINSPQILSSQNIIAEPSHYQTKQFHPEQPSEHYQTSVLNQDQAKLAELQDYIEQLHEECAQSEDLQKRFFYRWKIRLLEAIAQSLIYQMNQEYEEEDIQEEPSYSEIQGQLYRREDSQHRNYNQEQMHHDFQKDPGYRIQVDKKNPADFAPSIDYLRSQASPNDYWSRATSEVSQTESSLKRQKHLLKQFVFKQQGLRFLGNLHANRESKSIKSICEQVYHAKIMAKAFEGFRINCEQERRTKNMEEYCEELAQNQEEDQSAAYYFWKTTQLHRYFTLLSRNRQAEKMGRALNKVTILLSLRAIKSMSDRERRSMQAVARWQQQKVSRLKFRCFSSWKHFYRACCPHYQRLKIFKASKLQDLLHKCFSILKLQFKRSLVKEIKAIRHHSFVVEDKVFRELQCLTQESRQFRAKEHSLGEYLAFKASQVFISRFIDNYHQIINQQRVAVREERVRRMLLASRTTKGLRLWRKSHLKSQTYKVIEYKLKKLNQKQKKREILSVWLNAARRTQSGNSQSQQHKNWLVSYYTGLCSI